MVKKIGPEDLDLTIKFGGGLHTRASEDEIDAREAADGDNFLLDIENRELRNRPPFDLVGTVPNGAQIRGGASLLKADGTVSFLIQAGNTVYEWDGADTFTSRGSCNANAKLRGHWHAHNWTLDDKVLITDLNLLEVVKEWNGTTLANVVFTDEDGTPFGTFYAKYLSISNERAIFSAVRDPSVTSRHLIVGSESGNYEKITVANRPASALSEQDPFFLVTPDLKPINGHVEAFGTAVFSTEKGRIFNLTGSSAKDFAFSDFYPGSAASGEESLAYIGNDIVYGRQGRIESVRDTDRFGDAEADDLTTAISNMVGSYSGWRSVYNSRLNRLYVFPENVSEVWAFQTAMRDEAKGSPWMRWKTDHPLLYTPTFVMSMLDPLDRLEYVFMGDSSGNLYRLEGNGTDGDAGTNPITTSWLTKLFSAPLTSQIYNIEGYVKYRKNEAFDIDITFEYAGESIFSYPLTVNVPAVGDKNYFSGGQHYGGGFYYGSISGKLQRQPIFAAGQANEFQVRVSVNTVHNFNINEIGLRFSAAT